MNPIQNLNKKREEAIASGQNPYAGNLSSINTFAPTTITADVLSGSLSPIKLPEATPISTVSGAITGSADSTIASTDALNAKLEADKKAKEESVATAKETQKGFLEKYLGIQSSRPDVEKELGVTEKEKVSQDTYNALQASKRAQVNELRALESSGLTDVQRASSSAAINRKYAFEQADLSIAQDVANRSYTSALAQADRKIELQLEPIKLQLDFQTKVLEENKDAFTKAEQIQLENMISNNRTKLATETDRAKTLENARIDVYKSLSDNNAPAEIWAKARTARDINELYVAAGQYGGDMLARQVKNQQFQNAKLEGQKLTAEIEAKKPLTGEYASVVNGAAGLVANVKKEQVKANISSALANGNYSNAYAEIANAVSDSLTGTPKTKFDDARTDVGIMNGMRTAIQNYSDAGGDMNILKGTEEEIKRKLGVNSGKASALATQLWREFQTYRSNMTGAAFTPQESRDYASVNPTLGKSLDLNLNVIDGALSQLTTRITSTVNARIPDAQKIYNLANDVTSSTATTVKSNGQDYVVGQVYNDGTANWVVDTKGNWSKQ